jgi:hypothetical protein
VAESGGVEPLPPLPLGYDIRLCAEAYLPGYWADDRRERYLLRPEIEWPLSIDSMVWPSIFESPGEIQLPGAENWWPERPPTIVAEPVNKRYDQFMDLWPELGEMLEVFREHASPGACGVPIAMDLVEDTRPESTPSSWASFDTEVSVQARPADWAFLGYDVCDFGWISGLSNCGSAPDEMHRLSRDWKDRLNEFGLFMSATDAGEYCEVTDRRVPEHAPFRVFALYRAPEDLRK